MARKTRKIHKIERVYSYQNPFTKPYKIYNDGGHYVATLIDYDKNSKYRNGKKQSTEIDRYFDEIYFETLKQNLFYEQMLLVLKEKMLEKYADIKDIDNYITKKLYQKRHNYFSRIKRFKRKAHLNYWNYFVTITYDDKKQSVESFKKKLRKCLSNLHTRYGYKYMGVFELSPEKERLHFHAIMYIPENKMIGEIKEMKDYSTKQHKMQITHSNSFFAERFGRNDFEELKEEEIRNGNALEYLTKYLYKTNEKIIYSRGIPTEIQKFISNEDIATKMFDFVTKFVLFDDVIDYKRDVMHFKTRQTTLFECIHTPLRI